MSWRLRTDPSGFATRWSDDAAARYRAAGYWRDETLADVARRACREAPDRLLLIEGDRRVTRAEAWDAASRLAAFFLSRGLEPGDVVSFQLPNWIEAAVIALAARRCGLVLNPIPPNYRESEVRYILQDCRREAGVRPAGVPQARSSADARGTPVGAAVGAGRRRRSRRRGGRRGVASRAVARPGARRRPSGDRPGGRDGGDVHLGDDGTSQGRPPQPLRLRLSRPLDGRGVVDRTVRRRLHAVAGDAHHGRVLGVRHAVGERRHERADGRLEPRRSDPLHREEPMHGDRRRHAVPPPAARHGRGTTRGRWRRCASSSAAARRSPRT